MAKLHRVTASKPGIQRVTKGRGFTYLTPRGARVTDRATLTRIRDLAIPPAWSDVWICTDPRGHLQATGTDAAGRRQYLYHPEWRERRDTMKFRHIEEFAEGLPAIRRRIEADLHRRGMPAERVLACAVKMLDEASFRIGSRPTRRPMDPSGWPRFASGMYRSTGTTRYSSTRRRVASGVSRPSRIERSSRCCAS